MGTNYAKCNRELLENTKKEIENKKEKIKKLKEDYSKSLKREEEIIKELKNKYENIDTFTKYAKEIKDSLKNIITEKYIQIKEKHKEDYGETLKKEIERNAYFQNIEYFVDKLRTMDQKEYSEAFEKILTIYFKTLSDFVEKPPEKYEVRKIIDDSYSEKSTIVKSALKLGLINTVELNTMSYGVLATEEGRKFLDQFKKFQKEDLYKIGEHNYLKEEKEEFIDIKIKEIENEKDDLQKLINVIEGKIPIKSIKEIEKTNI